MLPTEAMYFLIHCLFRNLWNADDPYVYAGAHVSVPKGLTSILHQVAQVCAHGMSIQHLLKVSMSKFSPHVSQDLAHHNMLNGYLHCLNRQTCVPASNVSPVCR